MIVDQGHDVNQCPCIEKSKWNGNTDPKDTSKVTQEQNNPKVCVMGYSIRSGSTSTASQKALQAGLIWSLLSLSSLSRGVVLRLGRSANNQSISCLRIAQTPRKITDRSLGDSLDISRRILLCMYKVMGVYVYMYFILLSCVYIISGGTWKPFGRTFSLFSLVSSLSCSAPSETGALSIPDQLLPAYLLQFWRFPFAVNVSQSCIRDTPAS